MAANVPYKFVTAFKLNVLRYAVLRGSIESMSHCQTYTELVALDNTKNYHILNLKLPTLLVLINENKIAFTLAFVLEIILLR